MENSTNERDYSEPAGVTGMQLGELLCSPAELEYPESIALQRVQDSALHKALERK